MTTATTKKTKLDTLAKIRAFIDTVDSPKYTPIEDDKTFLQTILDELDQSWIIGEMCNLDGKKCLVGAGAYFSGAIYFPSLVVEDALDSLAPVVAGWENVEDIFAWQSRMSENNSIVEEKVGARLFELLDVGSRYTLDEDDDDYYVPSDDGEKLEAVIDINDNEGNFTDTLRPMIVAAIERLSV
jgi:hypothetical protein